MHLFREDFYSSSIMPILLVIGARCFCLVYYYSSSIGRGHVAHSTLQARPKLCTQLFLACSRKVSSCSSRASAIRKFGKKIYVPPSYGPNHELTEYSLVFVVL